MTKTTSPSRQTKKHWGFLNRTMAAVLLFLFSVCGLAWTQPVYVLATNYNSTGFSPDESQDLILGYAGTLTGAAPTFAGSASTTSVLTDGFAPGSPVANYWFEIQSGDVLTYNLGAPCSITSMEVCSTWSDNGRSEQSYTIDVSSNGINWTTGFISVAPPKGPATTPSDLDMQITPASGPTLTNNIQYVRFNFPSEENTWVGYTEIVINGTTTATNSAPTVTISQTSLTVTNGATNVSMSATFTGYPLPNLIWHFVDTNGNDNVLPGQTATNITIPLISPTDAGNYYVVAQSTQGTVNSANCALTVVIPPNVSAVQTIYSFNGSFDPLNTTSDLLLGLTDPNNPVPAMTDGSDNGGVATGSGFHSFGGGNLQTFDLYAPCDIYEIDTYSGCASDAALNSLQVDQNYTVSVSTNNGATYTNLFPVFTRMSLLYTPAAPADMHVQLTPNNGATVLASNVDHIRFSLNNDAGNPNLTVNYMEFMAYGSNKLAQGRPVILTDLPATITATQRVTFSLSVGAQGNPIPAFQWYSIGAGATNLILNATNSTYTVNNAQPSNAIQYQVVVSNVFGSVTSAVSTVVLYGVQQTTTTIYQDTFARTGLLIGSAPDTVDVGNATWVGYNQLYTDGSELNLTNLPTGGPTPNAFLPFTPQVGHVYTLSCDIEPLTGAAQWCSLGFALNPITNNYYAAVTCGSDWLLVRGNDTQFQIFKGPGTGGLVTYTGPGGGNNWPAPGNNNAFETFTLVLDTTTGSASSGWSMDVYTNQVLAVTVSNAFSPNPAIQYVGLGADAATGNFRNFKLTDLSYPVIPAQLNAQNAAGQITLTWPSFYIGWTLQSNSVGLQASNAWVTVPGSTATNQIPVTIDSTKSSVYYRLLAP
jgi:hypothetical protein